MKNTSIRLTKPMQNAGLAASIDGSASLDDLIKESSEQYGMIERLLPQELSDDLIDSPTFVRYVSWKEDLEHATTEPIKNKYHFVYSLHVLNKDIQNTLQWIIDLGVEIRNKDAIHNYLLRYYDMLYPIRNIVQIVKNNLHDATLMMTLYKDPEIDDSHLIMYARFKEYNDDIMDKIDEVRKKYRPYLSNTKGWFLLTTDFCSPL